MEGKFKLATQYPSDRSSRPSGDYGRASAQPGISRSSRGSYGARPSSGASRSGARPTSQRGASGQRGYSQGPSRSQYASGRRPAQSGSRRPASGGRRQPPRRRKPQGRFFAFIAVAVLLVLAAVIFIPKLFGSGKDNSVPAAATQAAQTQAQAAPETAAPTSEAAASEATSAEGQQAADQSQYASIADMLADSENHVEGLSADQMVQVDNLSINQNLPQEWMNILLLGTDERHLSDSARTDAMIICSINRSTGEVKLSSIMRDLAVEFTNLGQYNGTYRINSANYFGGPNLAMKTVNELFEMNIQYYVMVNFFGFQKIAERLGGVDVEVSEEEMELINYRIKEQYVFAKKAGVDESDLENKELETFGPNTHLDGRQTLAYARLRKTAGGDYRRAERQQIVLGKLMEKVKTLNALEITTLGAEMIDQVKTNMELNDIIQIALKVAGNGIPSLESFRLPVQNTYKEETRDDKSMLWDCDFTTNAIKLYDFIYE